MKKLIINADDFGASTLFNTAILELCSMGFITSTSVMVKRITSDQNSQLDNLSKFGDSVSIGLHLELTDAPLIEQIDSQYDTFLKIFNKVPTHIDIHKYPEKKFAYEAVDVYCHSLKISTRNHGITHIAKTTSEEAYFGTYKSESDLCAWLKNLKEGYTYEILFHPGYYDINASSKLNREREKDIQKIAFLNIELTKLGIIKVNYNDIE